MLFHLGALRLLNEAGWLPKLTRVSSVSGGSIAAGVLGMAWNKLEFDAHGVGTRFANLVERPILLLASSTIDIPAVVTGLWPGRIAERVARAYDKTLFHGATLQDLPSDSDGPRFILLATDLSNATLWRFSKPYMRTWRSEPIRNPTLQLAKAVASSSAFPPGCPQVC
jgi:NTE family protein